MDNRTAAARSVRSIRQEQAILIVDDTPANLEVAASALDGQGYQILVAQDGDEAISRAMRMHPDLILLDVMMPGIDGIETCRRLKLTPSTRDIPVIFMTALGDIEHKVSGFAAGGVDYITKPFQTEELLARVKTHLTLRAAQRLLAEQNSRLHASETRYRRLFETSLDAILLVDLDTEEITDVNDALLAMLDFSRDHFVGQRLSEVKPFSASPTLRERVVSLGKATAMRVDHWNLERRAGSRVDVEAVVNVYNVDLARIAQVNLRDITLRKQAEARVQFMALHDALTGLPNRRLLGEHLLKAIAQARRDQKQVAVMLLDLDHFKRINDSLGHHVGDGLLEVVANRLRACLRDSDIPARLGGDEFVIALPGVSDEREIERIARKILNALAETAIVEGHELQLSTSIGISRYPDDGDEPGELIRAADTALYQAKAQGRGMYQFYMHSLNDTAQIRLGLMAELRHAIARQELVLHYQPRFSMTTGKINGVEALLRWHHPTRGLVLPHDLLPLVRDAGLMIAVETWVLREACWQAIQWQRAGHAPIQVTVNLSIDPQTPGRIVQMVETVLDQTGLVPELLELDLSNIEAAKEPEAFVQALNQLKQLGVSLSLDDFGVGWSALSSLWRLPLDRIKIDRSVMPDIMNLPAAAVVVRGILNTITSLGLGCVAKGVETQDQVDFLRRETCAEFQGFLSGPAMPAAAVEVMLSESESAPASAEAS